MATILKIKRSSTNPTATPAGLGQGELAYGEGTSTYTDAQGATVTSYGKLFVGKGSETNGVAAGLDIIGGKYFTDLLDHGHGTIVANSAAIVDSAKKVDEWNVDNITLNGNTISTTNSNGDLTIDTNGTGDVVLSGSTTVGDNLFKINDGSTDRFVVDSFSGAVDISSPTLSAADTLLNISSTWNNAGATFYGIDLDVTNTASASTSRLLNLSVGGSDKFNVDLAGNVYLTGNISYANAVNFNIQDNTADAFVIQEGTNHYIDIDTTDAAELLTLGNDITTVDVVVEDNTASAFAVKEGSNEYIAVDTTDGSELITFSTGNVDIDNDLNIDGGDLTTNVTGTFNLLNTNTTTVNFAGAATTLVIGNASGNFNVDATGNTDLGGDLNVDGDDLTTSQTTFNLLNTTATTVNAFGAATTIDIGAATGTTSINNNLDVDLDLNVDGGDITTNQTSFNLLNTNATTVNFAGAATTIEIGSASGTTNVNNDLDVDGDVSIDGGDLDGTTSTFNLLASPTTVNFAAAGTDIQIGSATGTTNVNNDLDVDGDVSIDGGDLDGTTSTFNLLASPTTVNFAAAGTDVQIGSSTGTTNVNNDLDVDGDVNIDGGDLTTNLTSFNLLNTTATTVNFAGAATTVEIGASSGTTSVNNDLDVDGDVNVDGGDLTTNQTTFNLINTNATTVNFAGAATNLNLGNASTEFDFGDLRIVGSTIYSDNAGAQTITIDPFPAGGDSGGNVVVRGNLQVSGTTTTVNSTQMTINDPVFTLGDSISEKTVVSAANSGQADVVLDDVEGLNVGDIVSGNAGIPGGTTIQSIDTGTKTITLSANLTAGIAASTNTAPKILTFTQGADDNKDRGIEFKYFNGSLKQGFFGYDESGISEDVVNYYFTYIPEATNTSQVFSGTVGKAYFDTVKLEMGTDKGIPFFDQYKRLTRTEAAGTSDATTSYQILTVDASGIPLWTTTIDGGTY